MAEKKMSSVHVSWPRPDFSQTVKTNKHFRSNFHGAMMYVHYEISANDLKKEVVKYLRKVDPKHSMIDRIKDLNENRFTTVGKYMYLLNHGCDIPDDIFAGLIPALEKVVNEEESRIATAEKTEKNKNKDDSSSTPSVPAKNVISIQDRLKDKAKEVAGEVEGWIDDFVCNKSQSPKSVEEFVNLFKSNELKAPHMRYVQEIFSRRADEIAKAVEGDKDLLEGYCNFTKPELKKFDTFHKNLFKACNMMQAVAKVERAPRKKKPVSTEKLVAKLKFKKEDSTLGIVSISPVQIIGAKEVWLYNTKTRKLSQYKAEDGNTLSVKGTGILNFSTDSAEKTLRKPAEALTEFKKASKVKLRTFLKDLTTTDTMCTGKVNEHHIILRADK